MPRVGDTEVRGGFIWRYTETDQVDDEDDPVLEWRNTLMRPRLEEGGGKTSKEERAAKNRAFVVERGYDKIKLKNPRRKQDTWWSRIKKRNLIPFGGRTLSEKVPLVGGKRIPTMSLDDIDRATDDPGLKMVRRIDRTKEGISQKWQDHVKRRYEKGKLPLFGKTPEEKRRKKEERKRRRR